MSIMGHYLMPHPPIILPQIGKGEEKKIIKTYQACERIALEISHLQPETIIIITPHGPLFRDAIALSNEDKIKGDLAKFGAKKVSIEKKIDRELTNEIHRLSTHESIPTVLVDTNILSGYDRLLELDHGSIVPLSFIESIYPNYLLVHITYGLLSDLELYRFGLVIKEAVKTLDRKVIFIASGDLSHRLTEDGPYPYSPIGKVFDEKLITYLENGDVKALFQMDNKDIEEAGECGLNSIISLVGALGDFKGELLSYEGTFGVGYGVMKFKELKEHSYFEELSKKRYDQFIKKVENSDDYVKLARMSIEHYLKFDEPLTLPSQLPNDLIEEKAGVFVSLKKNGDLRGCIGTFLPTTDNIAQEIIQNALDSAFEDPRFNPLEEDELLDIDISVDVLTKPVKTTIDDLDPKKYGVIVSLGNKRGLLLPDLEGVNTIDEQLSIACQKAGINPDSDYTIEKFSVIRHVEGDRDDS